MAKPRLQNRIRVFRAEHRLTQSDLADLIGVSRKTISTIEVGRFVPSTVIALLIARQFNVTVEEVFWVEDELRDTEAASVEGGRSQEKRVRSDQPTSEVRSLLG